MVVSNLLFGNRGIVSWTRAKKRVPSKLFPNLQFPFRHYRSKILNFHSELLLCFRISDIGKSTIEEFQLLRGESKDFSQSYDSEMMIVVKFDQSVPKSSSHFRKIPFCENYTLQFVKFSKTPMSKWKLENWKPSVTAIKFSSLCLGP